MQSRLYLTTCLVEMMERGIVAIACEGRCAMYHISGNSNAEHEAADLYSSSHTTYTAQARPRVFSDAMALLVDYWRMTQSRISRISCRLQPASSLVALRATGLHMSQWNPGTKCPSA